MQKVIDFRMFMKRYLLFFVLISIELMFLAGFIAAGFIVQAWTGPTSSPPGGTVTVVPPAAVAFFSSTTCPSGWTEVTDARGRYLVGLPSGGNLASTTGTALTNLENRDVGQAHGANGSLAAHTHSTGGGGTVFTTGGVNGVSTAQGSLSVTVSAVSGIPAGTPAPYIQFLVCQKL